jgi:putative oxidoreductase
MNNSLDSISLDLTHSHSTHRAFSATRLIHLAGRSLVALVFVTAGFGKLMALQGTAAYMRSKGLPAAALLAIVAAVLEITAGVLVAAGMRARTAALALAAFLLVVTAIFHNPWGLPPAEAQAQLQQVFKNLAILGGLVLIALNAPHPERRD